MSRQRSTAAPPRGTRKLTGIWLGEEASQGKLHWERTAHERQRGRDRAAAGTPGSARPGQPGPQQLPDPVDMGSQDHSAILSQLSLDPSSPGDELGEPLSRGRQRWWRQYRPARAKERGSLGGWKPRLRGEAAPSSADPSAGQRAHQANARLPSPLNPLKPHGSVTGVCSWHRPCVRLARRSCG